MLKFPAATRFDTVWAIYGRWPALSRGHLKVGCAQVPDIQVQTRSGESSAITAIRCGKTMTANVQSGGFGVRLDSAKSEARRSSRSRTVAEHPCYPAFTVTTWLWPLQTSDCGKTCVS